MTYKPVEGYCALYPEEVKHLASKGLSKVSNYASAPCFAVYLALRQRAWNKKASWWKCHLGYLTIAKDLGWASPKDRKIHKTDEARITRALDHLRLMGMIVWVRGNAYNARSNSYSLTFYKECRERREGNPTPVSDEKHTSVPDTLHGCSQTPYTDVGPKNKGNKQKKKHSIITNERQDELESLFSVSSKESEEKAFQEFMGDLNPMEHQNSCYNNTTAEWDALENIKKILLACEWDWSFLLKDYDVEDLDKIVDVLPSKMALRHDISRCRFRLQWGETNLSEEINRLTRS